jgi:hypothetical protein
MFADQEAKPGERLEPVLILAYANISEQIRAMPDPDLILIGPDNVAKILITLFHVPNAAVSKNAFKYLARGAVLCEPFDVDQVVFFEPVLLQVPRVRTRPTRIGEMNR